MKFYRAAPLNTTPAGQGDPAEPGGAVIAIRLADLVSPAGPAAKAGTGRRCVQHMTPPGRKALVLGGYVTLPGPLRAPFNRR